MKKKQIVYLPFKRLIGFLGSIVGIIVCFVFLWWWVIPINTIVTKGHPFFVQERVGKNGKPFKMFKLRSMKINANPNKTSGYALEDGVTTKFGHFLRISSIDETVQLFNVFVGQMAFVGPRPLIDVDGDHITIEARKTNGSISLRPGISGYAQSHGRSKVDPAEKGGLDRYYYEHFGFFFDIAVFAMTIVQVFKFEDNS